MKFYLAPMEGLTGYVYRNAYHQFFAAMDSYFTPFLSPTQKKVLKSREKKDVAPEHNKGMHVVPQILTNQSSHFIETCRYLASLGYSEVNLNLGCPSKTVVTKRKGAGFLEDPHALDQFFSEVFQGLSSDSAVKDMKVSVKTRLGLSFAEEFPDLLNVYNAHPISELIVHPRVQEDFYDHTPDLTQFQYAWEKSVHPVCYNGDIFTKTQYEQLLSHFPTLDRIMLGRGILANPALLEEITGMGKLDSRRLTLFHEALYQGYQKEMNSERDTLFKMKALWFYLGKLYPDAKKEKKAIKKATRFLEYEPAVARLLSQEPVTSAITFAQK